MFLFFNLGSNSEQALEDMVSYAQETQHEKIIRGLAIGIALVSMLEIVRTVSCCEAEVVQ